jgi:predicted metalloprotease with PDZ domain
MLIFLVYMALYKNCITLFAIYCNYFDYTTPVLKLTVLITMPKKILIFLILLISVPAISQQKYVYNVDLTQVENDQLTVHLDPPDIDKKGTIKFFMPKIIPGTYVVSDYGKFIDNFQAFDRKGRNLTVERLDENTWEISKAKRLEKVTYTVEDTYDTDLPHQVYPMAGTNIEERENFVINTPGFFGYFEGMKELPFEVSFTKPENFYGSTGLKPVSSKNSTVVYLTPDYDRLIDSPIMFNRPDTTSISVGNAKVLISVHSPNNQVSSEFLAQQLKRLLKATKSYLGGQLPVDKYAFIYYFDDSPNPQAGQGALEHSYSSFYYLSEMPQEQIIDQLIDIAAHEFLHIVTPLTIHSEEIADFNFNVPELSRHLWLYEGVTEYAADHVQVQYDLISIPEYLAKLREKIINSKSYYNDTLSFTELSLKSADEHQDQYGNVYEKGALIAAMLDIRLNELSRGEYDLQQLLRDLSRKYGTDRPFEDDQLFHVIQDMTNPAIGHFFTRYVEGNEPLPLQEYLEKVGINYIPEKREKRFTLGNIKIGYDPVSGNLIIADISELNEFGEAMGYKENDQIISIQGQEFTPMNGQQLLSDLQETIEEGDMLEVVIQRNNKKITLQQEVFFVEVPVRHQLALMENPSFEQLKLRNQWLKANPVTARPEDVETIDAILNSMYEVVSGPAGERDWERFNSLFTPEATIRVVAGGPRGIQYITMSPEEYQERNGPIFRQTGFFEEEIGRTIDKFGNIAHIFSAYEYRLKKEGPVNQRGINSIQLAYFQDRWWITSLLWSAEENEKIPEKYLDSEK